MEVLMSTFNDSNPNDGGSDADRNAPDLGNGNSCGELLDQLDPLNQLEPLDPLEKISLLQSINNALEMLQGQSTLEILRTIALGLLRFPRHIVNQVCSEAALRPCGRGCRTGAMGILPGRKGRSTDAGNGEEKTGNGEMDWQACV